MKQWHVLALAGAAGVLSLLGLPVERLAPATPLSPMLLRILTLVQPSLLVGAAIAVGSILAQRVGLAAPLAQAIAERAALWPTLRRQIPPAILGAIACATILIAYQRQIGALLEGEVGHRMELPLATRLLYGGIAEELITRWGLVSFVAWAIWRFRGSGQGPGTATYWIAIAVAALIFAVAHLPILYLAAGELPPSLVGAIVAGNAFPGMVFGWLFWRHGLEAAMMAHAGAHLISWMVGG